MPEARRIYLLRHAKPELPFGGRVYYGATDYPLSPEGEASAAALGEALKGKIVFDRVAASDMIRARETARLAVPGAEIETIPAFREICLGEWEGRSYDEVREQFKEIYEARGVNFAEVAPPGGESFKELQRRTMPAFESFAARNRTENLLIVGHGAAIWSILAGLMKLDLNEMFFYGLDHCGMHVVEECCGRWRVVRLNWAPALK